MSDEFRFDVFLSHSTNDKPVVRELVTRLKKDGVRVWLDEEQVRPGDNILAKIEEGLEQSRVLVLCMSANAFGSDWTQLEAGTFRFRDPVNKSRRFIPLRLDGTPIKGSLSQFLYIDWNAADRQLEYAKLLDACQQRPGPTMATHKRLGGISGSAELRWTFQDLPGHRTRAYHRHLCEQYAGLGSFDLLELCNTWRQLAAEFTDDACESGRHGANVIHDPRIDEITRLLETACAARSVLSIDRLGRCLRRPDNEHLHYALATLDELEARLRVETVSKGGSARPEFSLQGVDISGGDSGVGNGGNATAQEREKASSPATSREAKEPDPIELACRSACGCAAGVDELRKVWDCEVNTPEEFVHYLGIAATVLRLVYHLKRAKELFPPVANIIRAVRPEPPASLSGVPPGASYHDMAIKKAEETLWCFAPDARCGPEVLDSISSAAPVVPPAELQRLFNDESPGSLRDRITKKLQEARRVPFLWDQLRRSMGRIEEFNADALVAAIEHEAALANGANGVL